MSPRTPSILAAAVLLSSCGGDGVAPLACEVEARLAPGEVMALDPTSNEPGCGVFLPAGAPGSRYRVAVLWPDSAAASATTSVTLHVEGLEVGASTAGAPTPVDSPEGAALPPLLEPSSTRDATARAHDALRADEAALVRELGTAGVLGSGTGPLGAPAAAPAPPRLAFDSQTSCSASSSPRTGVLLGENDVMAIYQDSVEVPHLRISDVHVQRMLSFYGTYGKQTVEQYFGTLPDVDRNGRVVVMLTAQAFNDPSVVAFVWAGNFYSKGSCATSDEAEIIYMNPARVRRMDQGEYVALGVLSHEAKHLVSLYNRLARTRRRNSSTFLSHPVWMEEGRAELADEVTARRAWSMVSGPSPTQVVGWDELRTLGFEGSRCCRPEAYGVALEAARTVWYLSSQPNGLALVPAGATTGSDIRNGGWHFHRWLGDAYGGAHQSAGADAALFRALNDSLTASGGEGLRDVLGRGFPQLFEEFAAAVMLHGSGVTPAVRGFTTYDFVTLTSSVFGSGSQPPGAYPWPVTTAGSGSSLSQTFETASYTGSLGPTGMRIHDFTSDGTGSGALLRVDATVPVRLVVARLR